MNKMNFSDRFKINGQILTTRPGSIYNSILSYYLVNFFGASKPGRHHNAFQDKFMRTSDPSLAGNMRIRTQVIEALNEEIF